MGRTFFQTCCNRRRRSRHDTHAPAARRALTGAGRDGASMGRAVVVAYDGSRPRLWHQHSSFDASRFRRRES